MIARKHRVFLALGSNVGDSRAILTRAIAALSSCITITAQAPVYETTPVGFVNQGNFFNTVIAGETELGPEDLLQFLKDTEKELGRIPRFRWGPREIDIDILFYDDLIYKKDHLTIPHPSLHERDFVLVPLAAIAADLRHPVLGKTIRELVAAFPRQKRSLL